MDRLFRRSGLYRSKWDRPDYRERTMRRAIARCEQVYQPPQSIPPTPRQLRRYHEMVAQLMMMAPALRHGKMRLIHFILIPALQWLGCTNAQVLRFVSGFVETSGTRWEYMEYWVLDSLAKNVESRWKPMLWERFFVRNWDLYADLLEGLRSCSKG